jgi:hypothetical protein
VTAAAVVVWAVVGVLLLGIAIRFGVLVARLVAVREDRDERSERRRSTRHAENDEGYLSK